MTTKSFRTLPMDSETEIAVIRYDGDPDVFTALAWAYCIEQDRDRAIEPPEPRLYRINPDSTGEHAWLLAEAEKRGWGVFLGARVREGRYFEPAWMKRIPRNHGVAPEKRIEARALELAEQCGCRLTHVHRPLARVQIDLEDAAAKSVGEP